MNEESPTLLDQTVIDRLVRDTSAELLPRMLDVFLTELCTRQQELRSALAAGQGQAITECSHALKSCAGTFGALALQALAREVESRGRQDSTLEQISAGAERLLGCLVQTEARFRDYRAALEG